MLRNYFSDLELTSDASSEEIRLAYRRLARRFHPDLNPDDPNAADAFRQVHEAFEFLSSPDRLEKLKRQLEVEVSKLPVIRKEKDRSLRISKVRYKNKREGQSLDLRVTLKVQGDILATHAIEFLYDQPCPDCREQAELVKHKLKACPDCSGLGFKFIQRGANKWKKSCDQCLGRGYVAAQCSTCHGKAHIKQKQIVEFRVPKNADPRQPICLAGLGNISFDGSKRGDVWVQLEVKK